MPWVRWVQNIKENQCFLITLSRFLCWNAMHSETHQTKHKGEWVTQKWKTKNVHSPCSSPPAISWTETSAKQWHLCRAASQLRNHLRWSWAAPSLFPQSNAAAEPRRVYPAALNTWECIHNNKKQKTDHVPKNLSARLLDCRARAVRKPLLSDGMMVDWQTKAPTKLEKSSDSATMSFRVTSVILSVQIAIFFPCGQSEKKGRSCWLLGRREKVREGRDCKLPDCKLDEIHYFTL